MNYRSHNMNGGHSGLGDVGANLLNSFVVAQNFVARLKK